MYRCYYTRIVVVGVARLLFESGNYFAQISLCTEILRELRKILRGGKKKSKCKARFESTTFCSTHKSPNHYTTDVVTPGNRYFTPFIDKPWRLTLLTIGNPSPDPPAPPIHTTYTRTVYIICVRDCVITMHQ